MTTTDGSCHTHHHNRIVWLPMLLEVNGYFCRLRASIRSRRERKLQHKTLVIGQRKLGFAYFYTNQIIWRGVSIQEVRR